MNNSVEASPSLLVVDDDRKLRELLIRYLGQEDFAVHGVEGSVAMDEYLERSQVDLIILDLMMPGEDGLSIARRLRSDGEIPIIMLTARGGDIDRIIGLEMGADDYLPKPFNPRELLARIRAVLRRRQLPGQSDQAAETTESFSFGDFTIDFQTHVFSKGGDEIPLTGGEYTLLEVLARSPNRVLTRDYLVETLKGYERLPYDRSIDVRVTRLRKKIEADPTNPRYIRTIWGKGYIFTPKGNVPSS
ncbi:MAG: two-component system response regulator OmpR [endosymbiont of Escarpia spicata]|uniref:Two-component system response regulator OmpR n=1 Tax=endosymbiont of Escarpia spicata TaxID=2200908 RepID=A0A370DTN0_9GAMM|nr:MAG: two-component system response regulator OmpR [endosymbiont of Escarpia spicata]